MKSSICKLGTILIALIILFGSNVKAQTPTHDLLGRETRDSLSQLVNTITTAVPFLLIAPDARGGAMGDAGVSSSPDANSMHWNPSKYAFMKNSIGFSTSYSPWLRGLVNDINLAYLAGYYKINDFQSVGASLRYFSLGEIMFTDEYGQNTGTQKPNEFSVDVAYARKFSKDLSGAVTLRFINSNLTQGQYVAGSSTHAGRSVASDISVYYRKELELNKRKALFAAGANISNIGAKINYTESTERDFIPINLRMGPSFSIDIDEYNGLACMVDINKLLVPTPPIYQVYTDTVTGSIIYDADHDGKNDIAKGKDPNRGVVSGIFGSFSDAPGGWKEELREISYSFGLEYWYDKQFAIRGGYFTEAKTKGNRKYFTLGAGIKYNVFGLDFAYLIPTEQRNPLENTLRFSLIFNFDAVKSGNTGNN